MSAAVPPRNADELKRFHMIKLSTMRRRSKAKDNVMKLSKRLSMLDLFNGVNDLSAGTSILYADHMLPAYSTRL